MSRSHDPAPSVTRAERPAGHAAPIGGCVAALWTAGGASSDHGASGTPSGAGRLLGGRTRQAVRGGWVMAEWRLFDATMRTSAARAG